MAQGPISRILVIIPSYPLSWWKFESKSEVLSGLVGQQVWHLITGCHLCVGSTPTSDNAEDLFQYDPGFWTRRKTPTLTLNLTYSNIW